MLKYKSEYYKITAVKYYLDALQRTKLEYFLLSKIGIFNL